MASRLVDLFWSLLHLPEVVFLEEDDLGEVEGG